MAKKLSKHPLWNPNKRWNGIRIIDLTNSHIHSIIKWLGKQPLCYSVWDEVEESFVIVSNSIKNISIDNWLDIFKYELKRRKHSKNPWYMVV